MKYLLLVLVLLSVSCNKTPEYVSNYGSFTIELKGLPQFDCKGFEHQVIANYKDCITRSDKDERGLLYYGQEEQCVRWAKQTWCNTQ